MLTVFAAVLGGCAGGGGLNNFDPTDLLDFLDSKKKLPGERKPVFPEGVPGLQPGVPKELYRGAQVEPEAAPAPVAEAPKARKAAKPRRPARTAVKRSAPSRDSAAEEGGTSAAPPPPKEAKPRVVRRRTTAPPPEEAAAPAPAPATPSPAPVPGQAARPATPQPAQAASTPFPAPLPSGSFTR